MTVIVLTVCPEKLRGYLTRWLLEVSAGVYVGRVSSRVREELWERVVEHSGRGRALMVTSARNEQGLEVVSHGHHWSAEDFDGLTLMRRPLEDDRVAEQSGSATSGWSKASGRRRSRAAHRK